MRPLYEHDESCMQRFRQALVSAKLLHRPFVSESLASFEYLLQAVE